MTEASQSSPPADAFLTGGGEMGERIGRFDWSKTPLGRLEDWPRSLKTATGLLLHSPLPIVMLWGEDGVMLYNDAYSVFAGGRHPTLLGSKVREGWPEVADFNDNVMKVGLAGGTLSFKNQELTLHRTGAPEQVWMNLDYSPVPGEDGKPAGVIAFVVETTAQVHAEARARAEQERQRRMLEQMPGFAAVMSGPDHVFEYANDAYRAIVGRRELIGRSMREAFPDLEGQGFYELLDRVRASGERFVTRGMEVRLEGSDEPQYLDFVYEPISGDDGEVSGIFVGGYEVTQTHRAAKALQESEEQLRLAVDAAEVGFWDVDVVNDTLYWPSRVRAMFGVLTDEPVSMADFYAGLHPDDAAATTAAFARAADPNERALYDVEYRTIGRDDGLVRWVAAKGRGVFNDDGKCIRVLGTAIDISARKNTERRREALMRLTDVIRDVSDPDQLAYAAAEILGSTLEVSRAGYGVVDPVAETITVERDWNAPGVVTIAGRLNFRDYGSYIEDIKRGETVVVANADLDPRTRDTADALKAISAHSFVNMPVTEQGGLVALLYLNHAEPRAWSEDSLALIRDVAERVHTAIERLRSAEALRELNTTLEQRVEERTRALMIMEEELRQSQKMEAVGQLTGGIAHDFNNLLAGISGSLELIERRIAQGRLTGLERYIGAAQDASRRAAALTQRLLAFSRRQTLDPKPTDVNRLIGGMEDLIRRSVGPNVQVEVVGAGGLWLTKVDPSQLENALLNLCINARDAMAPDGGRLTIETANKWLDERHARERDMAPGQYISLCVTDTGSGMTPEVIERAFDPFFTTKPLGEGTGLGLSMVYGFVRQSGGQVRIYSEVGEGTTMCLYLPRYAGKVDEAADEDPAKSLIDTREGEGETVLVIDDEPTVRMVVTEVLNEHGYTALEATDGPAGLRILQSDAQIDLLITDVGLPGGLNGRQIADAARLTRPDLKVLFITGYAENAAVGNGLLEPGMEVITKPFLTAALGLKIREMIDG